MKSRIHQLCMYQTVDLMPYQRVFRPDEAQLQEEFRRLQNRGLRWEDGTITARGDAALCALRSENPRFQKPAIHIAVGSGMLPDAIERGLEGMQVGTEKTVQVHGQDVHISLLSVKNKLVPELTDAWIAGIGLEGIMTLEQYRARLIAQQRQERAKVEAYEPAQFVMAQVLRETEFILFQEDWAWIVELEMARNTELCRQDGMDIKTMAARDFQGRIPATCYEGVQSLVKTKAWRTLRNYLLGRHYAQLDGYTVDEAGYEAYIRDYKKMWRVTEENARLSNTYAHYCVNTYASYFVDKVMAYVQDHLYLEE